MRSVSSSPGPAPPREVALFVRVLRDVFDHERWVDVEPCARRAWNQIALITGVGWEQVRERVRQDWHLH